MRKYSASVDLAHVLLKYAATIGIALDEIGESTGFDLGILEDPEARISVRQFNGLWQEIARRAGDQNFGLHLGEASSNLRAGGIVHAVMMNCATVGSALEKLARYHGLRTDFVRLQLRYHGDCATCAWEPVEPSIPLDRHHSEAVLYSLVSILRNLTEGQVQPIEIHFKHPRPQDITEHQRIFDCPLSFDQPRNELLISRADLVRPIFLANPELLAGLERLAQEMLDRLYRPDTWVDQVAHLISKGLMRGEKPTLDVVADQLAISTRHLQNKLREEGTTYQALLDQFRKETALRYLNEQEMTICDIAFLLGFSEQSAFNHAFKRWTGTSPREYLKLGLSLG